MNLSAIFSKTGKGVQEASGKTSQLSRGDRTVLSAIDGKTSLAEVQKKFEKLAGPKFEALIQQLDKDGFIREVSSGAAQPAAPAARTPAAPSRSAPPPKAPASGGGDDGLDFTQAIKLPPKAPPVDLAAASRAEAERKGKEQQAFDYKARQEAEAKAEAEAKVKARAAAEARVRAEAEARAKAAAEAKAEAEAKAREAAEAKGHADAEAKARAEADAKARAEADTRTRAESDAKVKSAREAALRMAADAKAKTDAAAERERDANEREREANERARKESEDKSRLEAELKGKLEEERKAREAADQARREIEEKAKRDADELRLRLEAEMKAKLEEERKKREEEDRKRREEEDERRAKEDAERRAREEADKKRREEEEQKRRAEEEARRKADDERRAREDAERRAKDDAERKAKDDAERRARDEEDRKRRKEEDERRAKDDAERRSREDAERKARGEADAKARAAQTASFPAIEPVAPAAPPPAAASGSDIGDSLLADLESFTQREDEEAKAKEEAERKAMEDAARKAKAEAERKAKDDSERRAKEEADKTRREEEERRAQEEAERKVKAEEEQRRQDKQEEAERKRKAKESLAAKQAEEKARAATQRAGTAGKKGADDDIEVSDDDLDMDELKSDQKVLAKTARKAALEQPSVASVTARRPKKWGKPAAVALFVLLIGGVGALQVMPISTAEYEKAASDAMGTPVKIASARLSVITGVEVRFEGVSVGSAVKIGLVRGIPEIGSLFGARKAFSRLELEGVSVSQSQLAGAVLGKINGENFRVGRIVIKQARLDGPLALPAMDIEAVVSGDGSLQSVKLSGGDKLSVQLSPKGNDIGFEISAGSLALPFVPALTLVDFGMKGTANRDGVTASEFDGRAFDGVISGTAKIRWGANWNVDGEVKVRAVKVAVFAPALVSEGKVEGRAAYSMSGSTPASLYEGARAQGEFKIEQGVLGSFDLARALQTGGAQTGGRTVFSELTGQGVYDKGTVQIRNVAITAGAMNAGASLDIDASGGLSGRISADVKAATQTLHATLNLSGKVQDPVIRK